MSTIAAAEAEIQNHPFVAGASREFIQELASFDEPVTFAAGQLIFREREYADRFYLIQEGRVELEADGTATQPAISIQTLGPGDVLGWSWLYPPYIWHFSARAKTACTAVSFKAPALLVRAEENRDFGYELMKRLSVHVIQRLQKTRELLIEERLSKQTASPGADEILCSSESRAAGFCLSHHNRE